ncbi:venom carboxylesterase-6-like [Cloeon dipterum]|uniref:venom carboxylesterase-6-like n=1 Tax=Cloeon dipterum TaxID=197152 RepID=UPI00321FC507
MMWFLLRASILSLLSLVCLGSADRPLASAKQGDLQGVWQTSAKGLKYAAFMGIPYAEPPVGSLRFEPPKPAEAWDGVLDAGDFGSHCISYEHVLGQTPRDPISGEEDCLFLNVFTPKLPDENTKEDDLMHVIIFFHGGAFMFGASNYHGAKYLMDKNLVLVTLNYRVGPLGFLSFEDKFLPGNNGLRDQVLAMRWVQDNINFFGGNKYYVTLMGLSAGGASVHYQLMNHHTSRLFYGAISISGTATCPWALVDNAKERATTYANSLGCDTSNGTTETVKCLKKKPAEDLMKAVEQFLVWQYSPFTPFGPVVESDRSPDYDEVLYASPTEIMLSGRQKRLRWMIGTVDSEGLYPVANFINNEEELKRLDEEFDELVPFLLDFNHTVKPSDRLEVTRKIRKEYFGDKKISKETTKELIKMVSDRLYLVDAQKAAEMQSQFAPIYFYRLTRRPSKSLSDLMTGTTNNYGTSHADDFFYLMNMTFYEDYERTGEELRFMEMMLDLVSQFASLGNLPEYEGVKWNWVDVDADFNYLHMDKVPPHMAYDNDIGNADFWLSLPIDEWTQRPKEKRRYLRNKEDEMRSRDEL